MQVHDSSLPVSQEDQATAIEVRIVEHMATVQSGFMALAEALRDARDMDLHKLRGYTQFGEWTEKVYGISRQYADRLMAGAFTMTSIDEHLAPETPRPVTASQVRPLRQLAKDNPAEAAGKWEEAVEKHGPSPTGSQVNAVVVGVVLDARGPEPDGKLAKRLWSTACRSCGHYAERHPGNVCGDCTCKLYSPAPLDDEPVHGDVPALPKRKLELNEPDENGYVEGDTRWQRAAQELQILLNTPASHEGINVLRRIPTNASAAAERLTALGDILESYVFELLKPADPTSVAELGTGEPNPDYDPRSEGACWQPMDYGTHCLLAEGHDGDHDATEAEEPVGVV